MPSKLSLLVSALLVLPGLVSARTTSQSGYAGSSAKKKGAKTWAVLKITYYDYKTVYEVMETKELIVRARELWAEFPIWREAHGAAKRQWHQWFSQRLPENRGRNWVLSKPAQPHLQRMGTFKDEIDAVDKVMKLKKDQQKERERLARTLYSSRGSSWPKMMYLNNLEANGRLVREMIPTVKDTIIRKDRQFAQRMSEKKKKELWDQIHTAEQMAKQKAVEKLKAKAKDKEADPGEPDPLMVYTLSKKLTEPILARYRINEWQWFAIWEEGHLAGWKIPEEKEMALR